MGGTGWSASARRKRCGVVAAAEESGGRYTSRRATALAARGRQQKAAAGARVARARPPAVARLPRPFPPPRPRGRGKQTLTARASRQRATRTRPPHAHAGRGALAAGTPATVARRQPSRQAARREWREGPAAPSGGGMGGALARVETAGQRFAPSADDDETPGTSIQIVDRFATSVNRRRGQECGDQLTSVVNCLHNCSILAVLLLTACQIRTRTACGLTPHRLVPHQANVHKRDWVRRFADKTIRPSGAGTRRTGAGPDRCGLGGRVRALLGRLVARPIFPLLPLRTTRSPLWWPAKTTPTVRSPPTRPAGCWAHLPSCHRCCRCCGRGLHPP